MSKPRLWTLVPAVCAGVCQHAVGEDPLNYVCDNILRTKSYFPQLNYRRIALWITITYPQIWEWWFGADVRQVKSVPLTLCLCVCL